ncbi:MAG: T9SS type A sorting domain-containing protein, partial [candidate division WOR-3 bacterium]
NNMNIDYVRVYTEIPLANDVGVNRIISPGSCHILNTLMPITVWIKNYGSNPQTNFPVTCSVIGSAKAVRYTNTVYVTTTLAPNDSIQVNVGSYTPTISEICSLIVRTNLTNDQYPANDRKVQLTNIGSHFLLLSEGFNNITFPPSGWQSVIINGNYNWQRKSYNENPECYPYEGSGMASYPSYDASEGDNARLISPGFNFGTIPIACSLKFNMYHDDDYDDCYDYVRVEYSTNGVNFIPVDSFFRYQPGPPAWAEHSIALGSFTGTFWLGIVGYSGYGNNINIDNVRLTGQAITNDVGIDAIIYPSTQHTVNTPMIPTARVKNYGSTTQTNFQVICSIVGISSDKILDDLKDNPKVNIQDNLLTDIIRYVDTLRISSLSAGETTRVSFRSWIPTIPEQCTVKIRTNLSGDQNPANDRKSVITEIIPATTVISPNGGEIWAGGTTKTIRWRAPQIYTRYVLLFSTNSGATYSDTIANNLLPTDSTYDWQVPMLNLRTCRIKLAIFDNLGNLVAQDASDADFTIDSEAPSIPILIAPANNAYLRDSMPCFRWHKSTDTNKENNPQLTIILPDMKNNNSIFSAEGHIALYISDGIANYQLQYAMNPSFIGAVQININDTFYQVPTRLIDTTYYWRVKAIDSAGNQSNWSSVWSFEIDTRAPNAPVLISPINGVWLTNTNVIFNWSQVTFGDNNIDVIARSVSDKAISPLIAKLTSITNKGKPESEFTSPVRYILQVDTNRNFTNPITDTTPYLYDTLTLTQAKYFWRVRAYDLAGNQGVFSSADSFGIDYTPPSVPNLVLPANNAILNDSFVRFYWNRSTDNVSGIKHYQIQIAKNSNFTNAFDTTVVDTTLLRKLTDTTYYWRVKAYDRANNQSNWSTTRSFEIDTRIPNAPVLISPINGIWLTNTNVIFNWSQVTFGDNNIDVIARSEGDKAILPLIAKLTSITNKDKPESELTSPIHYILQVDTNRNFTNPITDTTSYLYDTLTLTQAKYFWRVRAYDLAGNQGAFSSADSFGIDYTPPSVPNLISPANNAILNDSLVRFYWNHSTDNVSGIKHYQIQIAKNSNFTNAFDTTVVDTTLLRKLTDTTYYWRVKAYDRANNQSNWSTVWSFTVQTTGIEELTNIKTPSIFYLYHNRPNPFSNITEITYSIPIATKVKVTIFSATGEEIVVLINCLQKPGLYSVIWNGHDNAQNICPNGIYFYRLETKEFQTTKKMLLLK